MIYRPQRGTLIESMEYSVHLEGTLTALARHLGVPVEEIEVQAYCYDVRIDWDTWIVLVRGMAVGFTDREAL